MIKYLVDNKIASLAKKKGFDEPTLYFFDGEGPNLLEREYAYLHDFDTDEQIDCVTLLYNWNGISEKCKNHYMKFIGSNNEVLFEFFKIKYSIPTKEQLSTWLREKHGLHVAIIRANSPFGDYLYRVSKTMETFISHGVGSYNEAYNQGLEKALELI